MPHRTDPFTDMIKPKKIPLRQCVGCREHLPKRELIRVVRSPEGEISLDGRGKKPGRGAYICPKRECLAKARKSRALERMLECSIGDALYEEMALRIEDIARETEMEEH